MSIYKLIDIKNNDIHIIKISNNYKSIENNYYNEKNKYPYSSFCIIKDNEYIMSYGSVNEIEWYKNKIKG